MIQLVFGISVKIMNAYTVCVLDIVKGLSILWYFPDLLNNKFIETIQNGITQTNRGLFKSLYLCLFTLQAFVTHCAVALTPPTSFYMTHEIYLLLIVIFWDPCKVIFAAIFKLTPLKTANRKKIDDFHALHYPCVSP